MLLFSACSRSSDTELSAELEYQIKKALHGTMHDASCENEEADIKEISIQYYGSYGGYEAVLNTGLGASMVREIEAGGHLFKFGTSNVILLYRDGTFTEFQDVFKEGKITQKDLDRLYEVYTNS